MYSSTSLPAFEGGEKAPPGVAVDVLGLHSQMRQKARDWMVEGYDK